MTELKQRVLFCLVLLMGVFTGCSNQEDKIEFHYDNTYTFERQLAFAYINTEVDTNRFGGVIGTDSYLVYGVIEPDGSITTYEDYSDRYNYFTEHTLNISRAEYSYVLYTANRYVSTDGRYYYDDICDYDFYLTLDDFGNLKH